MSDAPRKILLREVAQHDKPGDVWLTMYDKVYDVSRFVEEHPGGVDNIMSAIGEDIGPVPPTFSSQNMHGASPDRFRPRVPRAPPSFFGGVGGGLRAQQSKPGTRRRPPPPHEV